MTSAPLGAAPPELGSELICKVSHSSPQGKDGREWCDQLITTGIGRQEPEVLVSALPPAGSVASSLVRGASVSHL